MSNAWIVQPQTVEKKLHASVISLHLAKKQQKTRMVIILVNILLHICFITYLKCKYSKESQTLKTVIGLVVVAVIQKNE